MKKCRKMLWLFFVLGTILTLCGCTQKDDTALSNGQIRTLGTLYVQFTEEDKTNMVKIPDTMNKKDWEVYGPLLKKLYVQEYMQTLKGVISDEKIKATAENYYERKKEEALKVLSGEVIPTPTPTNTPVATPVKPTPTSIKILDKEEVMVYGQTLLDEYVLNIKYSRRIDNWVIDNAGLTYNLDTAVTTENGKEMCKIIITFKDDTFEEYKIEFFSIGDKSYV